jgi:hypothetical protein
MQREFTLFWNRNLYSLLSILSYWLPPLKDRKRMLPKMALILVWQMPRSKKEEKRWIVTFIEHLLC